VASPRDPYMLFFEVCELVAIGSVSLLLLLPLLI